jgi:beta-glucosidase
MSKEALYPFGYGLSYTEFEIDNVQADTEVIDDNGVNIQLTISNTGNYKARNTVQVYVKAERPGTPNPQLKSFQKVELAPGQKKELSVYLPISAFSLCDTDGKRYVEEGLYTIYVGDSQPDKRSIELTGKTPFKLQVSAQKRVEIVS